MILVHHEFDVCLYTLKFEMCNIINTNLYVNLQSTSSPRHTILMSPDGIESVSVSHDVAQTKDNAKDMKKK